MVDRVFSVLVALSLAMLVWLYARSRDQESLDNVPVPVRVSLYASQAENFSVEINGPPQVFVSFSGPPSRIRELRDMLQRGEMRIDLNYTVPEENLLDARLSDTLRVEAAEVHAPAGVSAMPLEGRDVINITVHRLAERLLPVRFDAGPFAPAVPVEIEPPSVLVRGPQELLERACDLPTQPTTLPLTMGAVRSLGRVPLVTEIEGRPIRATPARVTVRVQEPRRKMYELTDVPVHFLYPANFAMRPRFLDDSGAKISLRISGPDLPTPPALSAFIDLTRQPYPPGLNHAPIQVQLPKDYALIDEAPRVIAFELVATPTPKARIETRR